MVAGLGCRVAVAQQRHSLPPKSGRAMAVSETDATEARLVGKTAVEYSGKDNAGGSTQPPGRC